jgi:hypothetical protein
MPMRRLLAWVLLMLLLLSGFYWHDAAPWVHLKTQGWSPLARALGRTGVYQKVVPLSGELQLDPGPGPRDHLWLFRGPESARAASAHLGHFQDPEVGDAEFPEREGAVRQALKEFGGPGSRRPSRTFRDLAFEMRALLDPVDRTLSFEHVVYFLLGLSFELATPGIMLLTLAAILAPDGPVWAWVFEIAAVSTVVAAALALGGCFPSRRRRLDSAQG